MGEKLTQGSFSIFVNACAREGWQIDQVESRDILKNIAIRFNLTFDFDKYMDKVSELGE